MTIKHKVIASGIAFVILFTAVMSYAAVAPKVKAISQNARNLSGLIAVDDITGDGGSFSGDDDLADLIVLQGLFPTSTNPNTNAQDLAALIAVDNIVGDGGGSFGKDSDDLADLIVLNNLFLDP